jgi:hypothetical protein
LLEKLLGCQPDITFGQDRCHQNEKAVVSNGVQNWMMGKSCKFAAVKSKNHYE